MRDDELPSGLACCLQERGRRSARAGSRACARWDVGVAAKGASVAANRVAVTRGVAGRDVARGATRVVLEVDLGGGDDLDLRARDPEAFERDVLVRDDLRGGQHAALVGAVRV